MELSLVAIRVLGTLMEKARTTPEGYPLTLNSLVNACNQKTSRDPVTDYDENEVLDALEELRENHLAMRVDMAGSRTAKFRENATLAWELAREEYALIAVLMLRGAQTPGQLRQRTERLYPFAELQQVNDWLGKLQQREEEPLSMVRSLPHAPGTKEIRWIQTMGPVATEVATDRQDACRPDPLSPDDRHLACQSQPPENTSPPPQTSSAMEERLDRLEKRVQELETLLNELTS